MIFKYRGIDREGKKASGRIEANGLDEAKRKLKAKGIFYDKVTESSQSIFVKLSKLRARPIPTKRLSALSRNLAIYLRSSIPILQAIKLAKSQADDGKTLDFLTAIETMLDEGQSFHTALETQDAVILPDFYKQSIKIAEENGVLSDVLEELSTEFEGKMNVYKVNTEEQQELAQAFGIQSIPSILFIPKDGQPQMSAGALPRDSFLEAMKSVLNVE